MRPDVKLGIIVSLVVVTVMGGYYLYRGNREAPILVDELDASDLVNNDKARAKNTNSGIIGKKNSASTKRQAATRRDLQTARRNTVNSARKSGQAGTPPSSIPSNQRQSRRQSSSSPLSLASSSIGVAAPLLHRPAVLYRVITVLTMLALIGIVYVQIPNHTARLIGAGIIAVGGLVVLLRNGGRRTVNTSTGVPARA